MVPLVPQLQRNSTLVLGDALAQCTRTSAGQCRSLAGSGTAHAGTPTASPPPAPTPSPSPSGRERSAGLLGALLPPTRNVLGRPRALFVDAAGTFLIPSEPLTDVYLRYGRRHGVTLTPDQVLSRFRRAYNEPWHASVRYVGDAREFWQVIVGKSLDCSDTALFEDIYAYYTHGDAWTVAPGFEAAMARIRACGVTTAVVSNFDTRLRPLLQSLGVAGLFDHVIVSAEVRAEKPSPVIFEAACAACGVDPRSELVIHVGDDRRNDVWGARECGILAWQWGVDVTSFREVADRVVTGDTML